MQEAISKAWSLVELPESSKERLRDVVRVGPSLQNLTTSFNYIASIIILLHLI